MPTERRSSVSVKPRASRISLGMEPCVIFFFFKATATTEIYTLSLHDALPICPHRVWVGPVPDRSSALHLAARLRADRSEGTRLNSSHVAISYAVFCLKKKKRMAPRPILQKTKQNIRCDLLHADAT